MSSTTPPSSTGPNKLDEAIERDVRPWLDLIDKLRAQGIQEETPLPQICVMGDQSSGKSSVLEALSGIQFPRGSGLVTRCPIQLIMKRTEVGQPWRAKARVAWHRKEQPEASGEVSSPERLEAVIAELMKAVCDATPNGFSTDSLIVDITSPECPDLTLIDLPGIVRTTVAGQTQGVIAEVSALIDSYLQQERTIILAIVPSTQDVATVDILERAQAVDPTGARTIGVLTKPDLISAGGEEEVMAVLQNKRKPLRLGYVMVRNRTQRELEAGATLVQAHALEKKFFANHPVFSAADPSTLGVEALTRRCVALLSGRIKAAVPFMKWELQESLAAVEQELRPLARAAPHESYDQLRSMLQIIGDFSRLLRASVAGEYRDAALNSAPSLRVRSRVDKSFRELQRSIAAMDPGFEQPDFAATLNEELKAHRGRELTGMVNSQFFFIFMLRQVERLRPIVEGCCVECCTTVRDAASQLAQAVAPQYPGIVDTLRSAVETTVEDASEKLQPEMDLIFEKEKNPFTENQDLVEAINRVRFERFDRVLHQVFLEAGDKPPENSQGKGMAPLQDWVLNSLGGWYRYSHGANPTSKVDDMSTILQAYWHVTSKRVCDNACMLFETAFLGEVANSLEAKLLTLAQTLGEAGLSGAFKEDIALVTKRNFLDHRRNRLNDALLAIANVAPGTVATSRRNLSAATPGHYTNGVSESDQQQYVPSPTRNASTPARLPAFDPVAPLSKPERRAQAANDGSVAHLVYTGDGDNGGLIYWLGTGKHTRKFRSPHESGQLTVTSSGMAEGSSEATLVSRKRIPCLVAPKVGGDCWLCVDVGKRKGLQPSHLSMCNGCPEPGGDLVNWVVEGYDDSIRMWVILPRKGGLDILPSPYGAATWPLEGGASKKGGYRFLRVRATGPNGSVGMGLPICALELYGTLYVQPEL